MSLKITELNRGRVKTLGLIVLKENAISYDQPFNIDNTVEVRFRLETEFRNSTKRLLILVESHECALKSTVKLYIRRDNSGFSRQLTCPQYKGVYICDLYYDHSPVFIRMIASKTEPISFPKLYEDSDFTDFYLSSEEGRVAVHRPCLAAHSDMFKTMLLGKWKETEEGRVELKGLTLQTLQQLKEYMYLGTLPEDVRQLLLLAKCYLLQNLREDCVVQLAWTVTSENLYELQEFAFENGFPDLIRLLLEAATVEVIDGARRIERAESKNNASIN